MTNMFPTIHQLKTDSTLPNFPNIHLSNYPLMIKEVKALVARNNKPYLSFTFSDRTGHIHANLWDTEASEVINYPTGRVALIDGFTVDYQGRLDIQLKGLSLLNSTHEYANPALYVQAAPYQRAVIEPVINTFLEELEVSNTHMYKLVSAVFELRRDTFFQQASSKKYRHAVAGGLAQHTVFMLQLAINIAPLYPNVNYDVLKSAILLHDLGKIDSLSSPVTSEDTKQGLLISATAIADSYLVEAAVRLGIALNDETLMLVRHALLANYSSAVSPLTREAIVIRHLHALDSDLFALDEALDGTNKGAFAQPSFAFNNRTMYNGTL